MLAWANRFLDADRRKLQEAMRELGRAISVQVDPEPVVRDVVERLPRILGLHSAALYLERAEQDGALVRAAGAAHLPDSLAADTRQDRR